MMMLENEDKINESMETLDSLIKMLGDDAASVKIEDFPDPSTFKYEFRKLKRTDSIAKIPTLETIQSIYSILFNYTLAAFSCDQNLKSYLCKTYELSPTKQWFYDLKEFQSELERISQLSDFQVNLSKIISYFRVYIFLKVHSSLIRDYYSYDAQQELVAKTIKNYYETSNRAEKENRYRVPSKEGEQFNSGLNAIIADIYKYTGQKYNVVKVVNAIFLGRCEGVVLPIIFNSCITAKVPNAGLYSMKLLAVFNLFKLMMKDKNLWSQSDFDKNNLSFRNYDSYKKKAVKNILQLK